MFERFTDRARQVVVLAQEDARTRRHHYIGTEHLLMGLFGVPDGIAANVLRSLGASREDIDAEIARVVGPGSATGDLARDVLATIGIDLDEVRRQTEEAFGPGALERTRAGQQRPGRVPRGHIPFTRRSKRVLEQSLREAIGLRHNYIGTEHILLGLLAVRDGFAEKMLRTRGVTYDVTRATIVTRIQGAAGA